MRGDPDGYRDRGQASSRSPASRARSRIPACPTAARPAAVSGASSATDWVKFSTTSRKFVRSVLMELIGGTRCGRGRGAPREDRLSASRGGGAVRSRSWASRACPATPRVGARERRFKGAQRERTGARSVLPELEGEKTGSSAISLTSPMLQCFGRRVLGSGTTSPWPGVGRWCPRGIRCRIGVEAPTKRAHLAEERRAPPQR